MLYLSIFYLFLYSLLRYIKRLPEYLPHVSKLEEVEFIESNLWRLWQKVPCINHLYQFGAHGAFFNRCSGVKGLQINTTSENRIKLFIAYRVYRTLLSPRQLSLCGSAKVCRSRRRTPVWKTVNINKDFQNEKPWTYSSRFHGNFRVWIRILQAKVFHQNQTWKPCFVKKTIVA